MKTRKDSVIRSAVPMIIALVVIAIEMWIFQLSRTNSLAWWGSFIFACITMVVLWTHKWFPKPSIDKPPSLLELSTPQALDKIYSEMVGEYAANQERFGRGVFLAVLLSSGGLAVAGLAQVLKPSMAGSLFIVIGILEITVLWMAWTLTDWWMTLH